MGTTTPPSCAAWPPSTGTPTLESRLCLLWWDCIRTPRQEDLMLLTSLLIASTSMLNSTPWWAKTCGTTWWRRWTLVARVMISTSLPSNALKRETSYPPPSEMTHSAYDVVTPRHTIVKAQIKSLTSKKKKKKTPKPKKKKKKKKK